MLNKRGRIKVRVEEAEERVVGVSIVPALERAEVLGGVAKVVISKR